MRIAVIGGFVVASLVVATFVAALVPSVGYAHARRRTPPAAAD